MFTAKKEAFEWIRTGQKSIELRRGKAKQGNNAVFQCGKHILIGIIVKKEEGSLRDVLREDNYKNIIPSANTLEEAIIYLKEIYGTVEGAFTAYSFELEK